MSEEQLKADLAHLHGCLELVKAELKRNTEITEQVRDLLATFRILALVAKWVAAIGAGFVALYHGWQQITGR